MGTIVTLLVYLLVIAIIVVVPVAIVLEILRSRGVKYHEQFRLKRLVRALQWVIISVFILLIGLLLLLP